MQAHVYSLLGLPPAWPLLPCPATARSCDVLGSGLHIKAQMVHSIGADDHGMFSVFEGCRLERNGSLEMHRWVAGVAANNVGDSRQWPHGVSRPEGCYERAMRSSCIAPLGQGVAQPKHILPCICPICGRALSTQLLFTDISIQDPRKSVRNGGPAAYGPNAGAYTTYWNVRSDTGTHPPPDHNGTPGYAPRDCTFGAGEAGVNVRKTVQQQLASAEQALTTTNHHPLTSAPSQTADLNFIGFAFDPPDELCPSYVHQQAPGLPPNLYRAQRERRLRLKAKSLPAGREPQGPWSMVVEALKRAAASWHY